MIQNIHHYSNTKLSKLFFNALAIRNASEELDPKRHRANEVLAAISQEWSKRIANAESDSSNLGDFPEKGMLATLGYHVGHSGEKRQVRHAILDYLMTEQLPLVDNPVYTAEWGEPLS